MLTQIAFALINGLTSSMAVFLVAAGVTLIFGILKILNFAHGSFFMIGAYVGLSFMGMQPSSVLMFIAMSILAGVVVGALGLATNFVVLRRLRGLDEATTLIATFSLLLIFDGLVKLIWGLNYTSMRPPGFLGGFNQFGPIFLPTYAAFIIVTGIVVFLVLEFVMHRMWVGKVVRALASDAWMATNLGINVPALYAGVVIAAFFLAGLAGALLLPNQTLSPSLSGTYLLQAFVVVIIGGLGNMRGAFIASILLGLVDSLNFVLLPKMPGIAIYFAMVAFLLWRPQGILSAATAAEPEAPHAIAGADETFRTGRATRWLIGAAVAAVVVSMPLWASQAVLFLGGLTLAAALFALSWNLMFGFTGLASFGHAAFFAIGAYLVGYFLKFQPGVPFLGAVAAGTLLGAGIALVVGMVAIRRTSGISLAILTLALSEILRIFIGYIGVLGAEDGLAGIPRPIVGLGFAQLDLTGPRSYFWFMCAATGLGALCLRLVTASRFGRALRAIRQDPQRTEFLGVNVVRYRVISFSISGGVAAFAGALQAPWTQIITPEIARYLHSTEPMLASLLGGVNYFWGPVLGAGIFSALGYGTRTMPGAADLITGVVLLSIVLLAPTGILGIAARLLNRSRRQKAALPAAATSGEPA